MDYAHKSTKVGAVMINFGHGDESVVTICGYTFHLLDKVIEWADGRVRLTAKEFGLAYLFFRNINVSLSRKQLIGEVWRRELGESCRTVDVHVYRLRSRLKLTAPSPLRLGSVHKLGYLLQGPSSIEAQAPQRGHLSSILLSNDTSRKHLTTASMAVRQFENIALDDHARIYVNYLQLQELRGVEGERLDVLEQRLLNRLAVNWMGGKKISVLETARLTSDDMSSTTVHRRLKKLRLRGLVAFVNDKNDERVKYVEATELTAEHFSQLGKDLAQVIIT